MLASNPLGILTDNETVIEGSYKDTRRWDIFIRAGYSGWSVLYHDGGAERHQRESSPEDNYAEAYNEVTRYLGQLELIRRVDKRGGGIREH